MLVVVLPSYLKATYNKYLRIEGVGIFTDCRVKFESENCGVAILKSKRGRKASNHTREELQKSFTVQHQSRILVVINKRIKFKRLLDFLERSKIISSEYTIDFQLNSLKISDEDEKKEKKEELAIDHVKWLLQLSEKYQILFIFVPTNINPMLFNNPTHKYISI